MSDNLVITHYVIVKDEFSQNTVTKVNELIKQGYQPHGSLVISDYGEKMQPMVKWGKRPFNRPDVSVLTNQI